MRSLSLLLFAAALSSCDAQSSRTREAPGDVVRDLPARGRPAAGLASRDPDVRAAARLVEDGTPWLGTVRIAPALADPTRRTAEARLVAARAAAGWEGWSLVDAQLDGTAWLDSLGGGEGRELLARAALARGDARAGARHAAAAVEAAAARDALARRLVLLARAHDRTDAVDSAAAAYAAAAELVPGAADWLRLRAAGVTRDDGRRRALLDAVRDSLARTRVAVAEATALERTGDADRAARAWLAAGDRVASLRVRLLSAESGTRDGVRREALDLAASRAGTAEGRRALELLDGEVESLGAGEALLLARAAWGGGDSRRTTQAYARANADALTARDHLDRGLALGRLGRWREARAAIARVTGGDAPAAAFQHARATYHVSGRAAAMRLLREVASRHAADAGAATQALLLLADLQTDEGRDADARATLRTLVSRYPAHPRAAEAAFRAAIIAIAAGDQRAAAMELDAAVARHPASDEALASLYWSGRAHHASGNSIGAAQRWRALVEREPLSYYATLARRRLGMPAWRPSAQGQADDRADAAVATLALLDSLDLDAEARLVADDVARVDARDTASLRRAAHVLREAGRSSASIAAGRRLLDAGAEDAEAHRFVFPLLRGERLEAESRRRGLDPALVAALIRQESSFNPRARSPADARGLMQVMPAVGRQLARAQRMPVWDAALLYDPDASLALGTAHLAAFLRQYDDLARALAAYNAGPGRVRRWVTKRGAADPELFTERIPFTETRDYVRIVQRNAEVYRALYGW